MKMRARWLAVALGAGMLPAAASEPPSVAFSFVLSDFSGPVRAGEARVVADPEHREVYVAEAREVHVFNEFGMKVYGFQTGTELGPLVDLAILPDGSLLVLAYDPAAPADTPRCLLSHRDFRGRALQTRALSGVPASFSGFHPNRLFLQGDRLLLLSTNQLLAAAATREGEIFQTFDLGPLLGSSEDDRADVQISGAGMDASGNLALSVAVLFRVFVISPEGKVVASWGKSGSAVGSFGNVGGVDIDEKGRTYVVDRIRKVVLVFDGDEKRTFLREFGGDPREQGALVMPSGIVLDGAGRAFVTQVGRGGVSVFQIQ